MFATRTILAPLTTTFSPPSHCTTLYGNVTFSDVDSDENSIFWAGQSCSTTNFEGLVVKAFPYDATDCWPKATVTPTGIEFEGYGFYSPGLYCPQGYTTACAAAKDLNGVATTVPDQSNFSFQFPLIANETAYGCCPTGMSCFINGSSHQTCLATGLSFSPFTTSIFGVPNTAFYSLWDCYQSVATGPVPLERSPAPSASFLAPLIQINQNGVENLTDSGASNGSLSSEAKIGIGVGVSLGGIILLAMLFPFIWWRRSRRKLSAGYDSTTSKPKQAQGQPVFKIAIICALASEAGMIESILDKDFGDEGVKVTRARGDQNVYTAGVISQHNIILAYMPRMGSNSAAAVAGGLRASFHEIEVAFVVGICGVAPLHPKTQEEILLGDCIVSTTVAQYDFGRQHPGGFERRNSNDNTMESGNAKIRSWISMLMTPRNRQRLTERLMENLEILQQKENSKAVRYPGAARDRLFQSFYVHKHHPGGSEALRTGLNDCDEVGCEPEFIIQRPNVREPIRSMEVPPKIHFGRFGSANTVMRSGIDRDNLTSRDQIIAFEMEGSGVWDVFPTVVVKAGCDYADSHKSKEWQGYAAATAGACLKALIERWPLPNEEETR